MTGLLGGGDQPPPQDSSFGSPSGAVRLLLSATSPPTPRLYSELSDHLRSLNIAELLQAVTSYFEAQSASDGGEGQVELPLLPNSAAALMPVVRRIRMMNSLELSSFCVAILRLRDAVPLVPFTQALHTELDCAVHTIQSNVAVSSRCRSSTSSSSPLPPAPTQQSPLLASLAGLGFADADSLLPAAQDWPGSDAPSFAGFDDDDVFEDVEVAVGLSEDVEDDDGCLTPGGGEVSLNLTLAMKQQLAEMWPEVQTRFTQLVPHEISEKVFWERFFRSKARAENGCRRERTLGPCPRSWSPAAGTSFSEEDTFVEYTMGGTDEDEDETFGAAFFGVAVDVYDNGMGDLNDEPGGADGMADDAHAEGSSSDADGDNDLEDGVDNADDSRCADGTARGANGMPNAAPAMWNATLTLYVRTDETGCASVKATLGCTNGTCSLCGRVSAVARNRRTKGVCRIPASAHCRLQTVDSILRQGPPEAAQILLQSLPSDKQLHTQGTSSAPTSGSTSSIQVQVEGGRVEVSDASCKLISGWSSRSAAATAAAAASFPQQTGHTMLCSPPQSPGEETHDKSILKARLFVGAVEAANRAHVSWLDSAARQAAVAKLAAEREVTAALFQHTQPPTSSAEPSSGAQESEGAPSNVDEQPLANDDEGSGAVQQRTGPRVKYCNLCHTVDLGGLHVVNSVRCKRRQRQIQTSHTEAPDRGGGRGGGRGHAGGSGRGRGGGRGGGRGDAGSGGEGRGGGRGDTGHGGGGRGGGRSSTPTTSNSATVSKRRSMRPSCSLCKRPRSKRDKSSNCYILGREECSKRYHCEHPSTPQKPPWVSCQADVDALLSLLGFPRPDDDLRVPRPLLIFGGPGVGKSFASSRLQALLRWHLNSHTAVPMVAPIGLLAKSICGHTIHSWAGIGLWSPKLSDSEILRRVKENRSAVQHWLQVQVLIFDDASLVAAELFDALDRLARTVRRDNRPFGGIQIVLQFDLMQLTPFHTPEEPGEDEASLSVLPLYECQLWTTFLEIGVFLELTEQQRFGKDNVLLDIINALRSGAQLPLRSSAATPELSRLHKALLDRQEPLPQGMPTPVYLSARRAQVQSRNEEKKKHCQPAMLRQHSQYTCSGTHPLVVIPEHASLTWPNHHMAAHNSKDATQHLWNSPSACVLCAPNASLLTLSMARWAW